MKTYPSRLLPACAVLVLCMTSLLAQTPPPDPKAPAPTAPPKAQEPPTPPPGDPFVKKTGAIRTEKTGAGASAGGGVAQEKDAAPAEERDPAPSTNILVTWETFSMPLAELHALLDAGATSLEMHRRAEEIVSTGKGTLEQVMSVSTRSGQRALVESVDELLFPTEFDPGQVPGEVAFPTSWEMTPLGDHVEVELVMGPDGKQIDLNSAPVISRLSGWKERRASPPGRGQLRPDITKRVLTTAIATRPGEPAYMGTLSRASRTGQEGSSDGETVSVAFMQTRYLTYARPVPKAKKDEGHDDASGINLRLTVTAFSMDRAAAQKLLVGTEASDAIHARVLAEVMAGRAKLERAISTTTRSGQRSTVEETEEFLYGTAASPLQHPATKPKKAGAPAPEMEVPAELPLRPSVLRPDAIAATFTAFEQRNVGMRLEVDPVLGPDGSSVDVNLAPEIVQFRGLTQGHPMLAIYPEMPVFASQKLTTAVTLPLGHHALLGTFSTPRDSGVNDRKDDGRTWLAFMHVVAVP